MLMDLSPAKGFRTPHSLWTPVSIILPPVEMIYRKCMSTISFLTYLQGSTYFKSDVGWWGPLVMEPYGSCHQALGTMTISARAGVTGFSRVPSCRLKRVLSPSDFFSFLSFHSAVVSQSHFSSPKVEDNNLRQNEMTDEKPIPTTPGLTHCGR